MLNRVERLTATLLLLQERKRTAEAIGQELGVTRRTVLRDVQALSAMGVPVAAQSGPNGGYEIDRRSTLAPLHLTWREALLLMLAVDGLTRMADTPFRGDRASLVAKLQALLPPAQRDRVEALLAHVRLEVPVRPQRTPLLDRLVELCGSWVSLDYAGTVRTVRVERIYADRGFWYISGACGGQAKTFRADRVRSVELCSAPSDLVEPLPYDHPSHPLVEVWLSAEGARRAQADPHLGPHVAGEGGLAFRCPPSELDWYGRFFAGLGEQALVQGPPELLDRIRAHAYALVARYGPPAR